MRGDESDLPIVSIVMPCYNEEEALPETVRQMSLLLERLVKERKVSEQSKMLLVDDGSRDKTWSLIDSFHRSNRFVSGLKLSRNVGHQRALLAGLLTAKEYADCIISIDADLQDDITVIDEFIEKYKQGYEVVYGVRNKRTTDTMFKKFSAQFFYKLMIKLGVNVVYNHADYRMMSRKVVDKLEEYQEVNLFLRGIIPTIGFKSDSVYYDRLERTAGESKYPLKKMLIFAWEGITSFSVSPIRAVSVVGFFMSVMSLLFAFYVFVRHLQGNTVSGWSSMILSIWFIGGIQLLCIGLIGEYIGKIYIETKKRPKYFVETELHNVVLAEPKTKTQQLQETR
ncbi:glycosyltransferase family 2 protein [Paenibacillus sp. FSL H8-0537]|uniref:glycosyltransferase family 2 protein n=1 Tax=Paenibacillus sp. FSL H8-0537 TaxID=2921399 RepID=UPI003101676A